MAGIGINTQFDVNTSVPIDSRLVLTKAQMLSMNDNIMPDVYGAFCSDDQKFYTYRKTNSVDSELGKFRLSEGIDRGARELANAGIAMANKALSREIPQSNWTQTDDTATDYIKNKPTLGTASAKDATDTIRPNSHELVESGAVYNAINQALDSIYTPRGELTCAELTSALLIEANVGSVYQMSDAGTTTALFIQGAGHTISVNDNVGIVKAGQNTYLFNLMGNAFDLHEYQKKELTTPIIVAGTSETEVEDTLDALNVSKVDRVNSLPTATVSELGKIYQYVGTTTSSYIKGYFYECKQISEDPATYEWVLSNTQPGGSSIFYGTQAEWDTLPLSEKQNYDYAAFSDGNNPINQDCLSRAKSTGWWNYGESNGLPAGLIRSGYIPKKVVFLGNSFTAHRPVEPGSPEGYVWTVYDWRAMAASTPTSDWTSIVYNKLKFINPDIEVRKASIINWEGGTLGSRSLSLCLNDESCAELKDDGGHYLEGVKIADILTPDVDVIIWQGYENMESPTATQADFEAFTNDFSNLWTELRTRCPKATLYDYCGWWTNSYKDMCIVASCYKHDVEVIWQWETKLPAWITDAKPNLEAQVGDSIYDADGNVICTVDSHVAGHSNDLGHRYIAFYVLDALFNLKTHSKQSLLLGWNSEYTDPSEPGFFDRHYFGSISYTNTATLLTSDFSTWNDFDGVFIECNIPVTVWADTLRHGVFTCEVDNKRWRYGAGPAVQKINVLASAHYGEIVYNRTWVPDVMYNEQWKDWVVTSAPMKLVRESTNDYVSEDLSFNGLVVKKFTVTNATTGNIAIPGNGFPHVPLFAFVQDHSGGYGPSAAYRASYDVAIRISDASHLYIHTMEIKQDGTVTVDATVPQLDVIVFGY